MAKPKKRDKKVLKVLAIILCVVVLLVCVNMLANTVANSKNTKLAKSFETVEIENQLVPQKDENGNWTFVADRELKILQLTDIHIGGGWLCAKNDAKAINAVAAMITAEKPDLVVVTGDMVYPVPYEAAAINNLPPAKIFIALMENLGVYWMPTFGNHDTEFYSFYDREAISDYYESANLKYCLYQAGPEDVDGYGNTVINVKNSQGIITQSLYTIDSNAYAGKGLKSIINMKYDNIHENQVEWYKNTVTAMKRYNTNFITNGDFENKDELLNAYGTPKSLAFFHIPMQEYGDAWFEYLNNGFKDTENVKHIYGTATETGDIIYCGVESDMLFETMLELGSTQGVFCGHDHINDFSLEYKGIRLTYGKSIDYIAYADIHTLGSQRGCTVITVRPDGTFDCKAENYYQDKYDNEAREDVTMQELVATIPEK